MTSRRLLKAASAIREVVSSAILMELRDPRVRDVTVTNVEVAPDMRIAKVSVSIMGDEKKQNLGLIGLRNSAGFLQSKITDRIETRYTPRLVFEIDKGVKHSIEVARILRDVLTPSHDPVEDDKLEDGEIDSADPAQNPSSNLSDNADSSN
jgi:ribosome-binding factor A